MEALVFGIQEPRSRTVRFGSRRELIRSCGPGRLLNSQGIVVLDDSVGPGDYKYIVACPDEIIKVVRKHVDSNRTLNLNLAPIPSGMRDFSVVAALAALEPGDPEFGEEIRSILSGSKEWRSGLVEAVLADDLRGLLEYISPSPAPALADFQYSDGILGAMVQGWRDPYTDPAGVLDYVYSKLNDYSVTWYTSTGHQAAWTSVIQSSGWGKSRTLWELHTKGVYVLYLSFMPSERRGYPPASPLTSLLTNVTPREVAVWLVAMLKVMVESGLTPAQWMEWQRPDTAAHAFFVQKTKESMLEFMGELACFGTPPTVSLGTEDWRDRDLKQWVETKSNSLVKWEQNGQLRVLFCIDEANSLFSRSSEAFVNTRRAFSCMPRASGLFGVITDTTAKLHGHVFSSENEEDPGSRFLRSGTLSFPPISLVGICYSNKSELLTCLSEAISGSDPTRPSAEASAALYKWGRPLWQTLLRQKVSVSDMVQYACEKLLCGMQLSSILLKDLTDSMCLVLLSIAAGIDVTAFSEVASDMVASNMRTATFVSENQDRIYSADALEPILGEAAAQILAVPGVLTLVLQTATRLCKESSVLEGPRGELVGRLCLVLAMHNCCESYPKLVFNTYSHPVRTADFLTELCGKVVEAAGLVCFNRCIVVDRVEITRRLLLVCFAGAACIIPQGNQEAYDVLVPKLMPGPDGKYELTEERMQAIPIQIRNRDTYTVNTARLSAFAEYFCTFDSRTIRHYVPASEVTETTTSSVPVPAPVHDRGKKRKNHKELDDEEEHHPRKDIDGDYEPTDEEEDDRTSSREVRAGLRGQMPEDRVGVYLHLRGRSKSKTVTRDGNILVLHGIQMKRARGLLKSLRLAFFKLEDAYKTEPAADKILRLIVPTYMKPKLPVDLHHLSTDALKAQLKEYGGRTSGEGGEDKLHLEARVHRFESQKRLK